MISSTNHKQKNIYHTGIQSVHNEKYKQGNVNKVSQQVVTKYINISSKFKRDIKHTNSNFDITLGSEIDNVVSMKVLSCEIPNTFYNITIDNNVFWISTRENDDFYEIEIVPGKYDLDDLINTLITDYSNVFFSSSISTPDPIPPYDINYNVNTGKVSIEKMHFKHDGQQAIPTNFILSFIHRGQDIKEFTHYNSIGFLLGFKSFLYRNSDYYESESIATMSLNTYLYLVIDDFNNNMNQTFIGSQQNSHMPSNVITRYSISNPNKNFTLTDINNRYDAVFNSKRIYHGPVKLTKLRIQLMDEFSRIIDLNGAHMSLLLEVETIYNSTI